MGSAADRESGDRKPWDGEQDKVEIRAEVEIERQGDELVMTQRVRLSGEEAAALAAQLGADRDAPFAGGRLVAPRFGLELDQAAGRVCLQGEELPFRPQSYELLRHFMQHAGQVLRHDELLQAVWNEQHVGALGVLRSAIRHLRHDLQGARAVIVTVSGQGYRFEG